MMATPTLKKCIESGEHLMHIDSEGFCDNCGESSSVDETAVIGASSLAFKANPAGFGETCNCSEAVMPHVHGVTPTVSGYKESPVKPKRSKRVRKTTATRKTLILEVTRDTRGDDPHVRYVFSLKGDGLSHFDLGLFETMDMDFQDGDEVEVTAKIVSRLKRVRL